MGQIGRFIDAACAARPESMQKVLEREWGPLRTFVDDDCGCLVGSMALVEEVTARVVPFIAQFYGTCNMFEAYKIGERVYRISLRWQFGKRHYRLRTDENRIMAEQPADARTTNMLKRRIRKALAKLNRPEDTMTFAPKPAKAELKEVPNYAQQAERVLSKLAPPKCPQCDKFAPCAHIQVLNG